MRQAPACAPSHCHLSTVFPHLRACVRAIPRHELWHTHGSAGTTSPAAGWGKGPTALCTPPLGQCGLGALAGPTVPMCSSPALPPQRLYSRSVLETMTDIISKAQEVLKVSSCHVAQGCKHGAASMVWERQHGAGLRARHKSVCCAGPLQEPTEARKATTALVQGVPFASWLGCAAHLHWALNPPCPFCRTQKTVSLS